MTEGSTEGPSTSHLPLERVRSFVQAHDPTLEPIVFETPLPTSEAAADALGVAPGQVAKSILFRSDDAYGLFVTAGDRLVPAREVKRLLGGKKPRIATPDEVLAVTGYPVGAVCPFALRQAVPVFVDASLQRFDTLYTAAGIAESLLPVGFNALVAMTDATVVPAEEAERKA